MITVPRRWKPRVATMCNGSGILRPCCCASIESASLFRCSEGQRAFELQRRRGSEVVDVRVPEKISNVKLRARLQQGKRANSRRRRGNGGQLIPACSQVARQAVFTEEMLADFVAEHECFGRWSPSRSVRSIRERLPIAGPPGHRIVPVLALLTAVISARYRPLPSTRTSCHCSVSSRQRDSPRKGPGDDERSQIRWPRQRRSFRLAAVVGRAQSRLRR